MAAVTSSRSAASALTSDLLSTPPRTEKDGAELGLVEAVERVRFESLPTSLDSVEGPSRRRAGRCARSNQGGHVGRPDGASAGEKDAELDPLIAAHAGVRDPAGGVVGFEAGDDLSAETRSSRFQEVADAEAVGDPAGVLDGVHRAASPVAGLLAVGRPHGQGDAEGLDAAGDAARGGDAAVDPTGEATATTASRGSRAKGSTGMAAGAAGRVTTVMPEAYAGSGRGPAQHPRPAPVRRSVARRGTSP